MLKKLRIGLTGSSGFIGSSVLRRFDEHDEEVTILDGLVHPDSVRAHYTLPAALDWILHFGATKSVGASFSKPVETYRRNLYSTMAALEIALKTGARFLYMSSYVYGKPLYLPIDEEHPVGVLNPYMGSKLLGEELCAQLHRCTGITVLILRGFTIYGPGQKDDQLISSIVQSIRTGQPIIVCDPEPRRDHLHVDDLVRLVEIIAHSDFIGYEIYNVGGGAPYSNMEVAALANKIAGSPVAIRVEGTRRENDIVECYAKVDKVSRDFGWYPEIRLEDGLCNCLTAPEKMKHSG
ncbi:MAG: NAD-dependent epimerase/dehydratase family protein [Syntrophales bacterium]